MGRDASKGRYDKGRGNIVRYLIVRLLSIILYVVEHWAYWIDGISDYMVYCMVDNKEANK